MVSYQHGTVYGKQEVPSFAEQSPETQLMIAQFAGQGYLLIGADYFGLGVSTEPEGYMVKAQPPAGDLRPSDGEPRGAEPPEARAAPSSSSPAGRRAASSPWHSWRSWKAAGITVQAAATASAPVDVFVRPERLPRAFPRKNDATWVTDAVHPVVVCVRELLRRSGPRAVAHRPMNTTTIVAQGL